MNLRPTESDLRAAPLGLLFLALVIMTGCAHPRLHENAPHHQDSLVVVSYGAGAYQASQQLSFCEPFGIYSGTVVVTKSWSVDYSQLRAAVIDGSSLGDVVEVTAAAFYRGREDSLFAPLTVLPPADDFLPGSVDPYGVANLYWSTVLAFPKSAGRRTPQNWREFFDTKRFPGLRAIYDDPRGTLEIALLADGVKVDSLYPLDVKRALKKLESIHGSIGLWWKDGAQPIQAMLDGEVAMAVAWGGRILASQEARRKIGYTWTDAALERDYWVVPKRTRNRDLASRFIVFASSPCAMAQQASIVGYGPVNTAALPLISEERRIELPTFRDNWSAAFVIDAQWWAAHEEAVMKQWSAWRKGH